MPCRDHVPGEPCVFHVYASSTQGSKPFIRIYDWEPAAPVCRRLVGVELLYVTHVMLNFVCRDLHLSDVYIKHVKWMCCRFP